MTMQQEEIDFGFKTTKQWLKTHVDVKEIELNMFSEFYIDTIVNNLKINRKDAMFTAYQLLDSEKNVDYNNKCVCFNEKYIYVIFEEFTKSIISNSAKLKLELEIVRGISLEDVRKKTVRFTDYCTFLRCYSNGEY